MSLTPAKLKSLKDKQEAVVPPVEEEVEEDLLTT